MGRNSYLLHLKGLWKVGKHVLNWEERVATPRFM